MEARDRTSSASTSGSAPGTRSSNPLAHLLAGAIGGALSRTATAPIQTVRLRMVAGAMDGTAAAKGGLAGEIALLARREGWRALYRGNLANVVRFAPTKGLDFFTFKVYKEFIGDRLLGDALGDGDGGDAVVSTTPPPPTDPDGHDDAVVGLDFFRHGMLATSGLERDRTIKLWTTAGYRERARAS